MNDLPTLDLLDDLYNKLGFRIGLDALADATLGTKKSGDGSTQFGGTVKENR